MRYITPYVTKDLEKKMVFIGGPRQVGKTTLANQLIQTAPNDNGGLYLNWDYDDHRRAILAHKWTDANGLIIFDEVHKYKKWKNFLKGVYDVEKEKHHFLVTGSARLDVYRRGGDSLLGRYHYWRLHPFTLSEIPEGIAPPDALNRLMRVGGFPEPFLGNDETEARRWRRERYDRILKDDVRDLEPVRDIQMLGVFLDALRQRVGGLVVLSNIAEEIQISPKTLKKWLEVLERMYIIFIVRPLVKNISRAIQKPPKVYFFDNADVLGDEGARFENLVATHLIKRLHFLEDRDGYRYELAYVRDKEKREVDFVILKEGKVVELLEVKLTDDKISTALHYYTERLKPTRSTQIVHTLKQSYQRGLIRVMGPLEALSHLD